METPYELGIFAARPVLRTLKSKKFPVLFPVYQGTFPWRVVRSRLHHPPHSLEFQRFSDVMGEKAAFARVLRMDGDGDSLSRDSSLSALPS